MKFSYLKIPTVFLINLSVFGLYSQKQAPDHESSRKQYLSDQFKSSIESQDYSKTKTSIDFKNYFCQKIRTEYNIMTEQCIDKNKFVRYIKYFEKDTVEEHFYFYHKSVVFFCLDIFSIFLFFLAFKRFLVLQ